LSAPFRGSLAPLLKQDEIDNNVDVQLEFHSKFFDLSIEEQKREYDWVMDRIVNGLFVHHKIDQKVNHETGRVTTYIEWSQRYAQLSPQFQATMEPGHVFSNSSTGVSHSEWSTVLAGQQHPSVGI
jgi:hypothetical protein